MKDLITDISTFSLSIFGIGMTIFTVIYSFISTKKEYINEMSDVITSGKACPETRAKFNIALKYIKRQKKNNTIILIITIGYLMLYVLSLLYLRLNLANDIFGYVIVFLNVILTFILFYALIKFINTYIGYVK